MSRSSVKGLWKEIQELQRGRRVPTNVPSGYYIVPKTRCYQLSKERQPPRHFTRNMRQPEGIPRLL